MFAITRHHDQVPRWLKSGSSELAAPGLWPCAARPRMTARVHPVSMNPWLSPRPLGEPGTVCSPGCETWQPGFA